MILSAIVDVSRVLQQFFYWFIVKYSIKVPFTDNDKIILIWRIFRDMFSSECLICNTQKIFYTRILIHGCCGAKIEMIVSVLDLNVNDCPVLL